LGNYWDKIGWVFVPATVGEIVGSGVWGLDRAGIVLVIVVDYTADNVWLDYLRA
jgi:hypothetical protein